MGDLVAAFVRERLVQGAVVQRGEDKVRHLVDITNASGREAEVLDKSGEKGEVEKKGENAFASQIDINIKMYNKEINFRSDGY